MTTLTLHPAMPLLGPADPDASIWVGAVDVADLAVADGAVALVDAADFSHARLLVRDGRAVRGYVSLPVDGGTVSAVALRSATDDLPPAPRTPVPAPEPITVVLCTHERPDSLRAALRSIAALDYPHLETVVVDNAPRTSSTRDLIAAEFPDFRYVVEERKGLSFARNAGLAAARYPIVAYTDDDTLADPQWLWGIMAGFARGDDVACVTGVVPSGELRNAIQCYFDARVSWSKLTAERVFRMSEPPADLPMFPFCVGEYGTGANFAVRRDVARALGSFDTALGAGTETQGGEDLDLFARVVFAGYAIAVEPSAVIWHRHRDDVDALRSQAVGYGRGLGAWLATVALRPRMLGAALVRAPRALSRLIDKPMSTVDTGGAATPALDDELQAVGRLELRSVLGGPGAYYRELRRQQESEGRTTPTGLPSERRSAFGQFWGLVAVVAAVAGLLALIPSPAWVRLPLVLLFVLAGPGAVLRAWVPLPPFLAPMVVPAVGVALVILVTTAMAFTALWSPAISLLAMGVAVLAAGVLTLRAKAVS